MGELMFFEFGRKQEGTGKAHLSVFFYINQHIPSAHLTCAASCGVPVATENVEKGRLTE